MDRKTIRRYESKNDIMNPAKALWVSTILSEYYTVVDALNGRDTVYIVAVPEEGAKGDEELAKKVYDALDLMDHGIEGGVDDERAREVARLVKMGKVTGNCSYCYEAALMVDKDLGTDDGYVKMDHYSIEVIVLDITKEDAERIRELGDRVADVFAKLGGRATSELSKLIFSGYKDEVVDSLELSGEEKEFLKELLDRPYDRAAIVFAYRRLGNFRHLLARMFRVAYFGATPAFMVTYNPGYGEIKRLADLYF